MVTPDLDAPARLAAYGWVDAADAVARSRGGRDLTGTEALVVEAAAEQLISLCVGASESSDIWLMSQALASALPADHRLQPDLAELFTNRALFRGQRNMQAAARIEIPSAEWLRGAQPE